MHLDRFVIYFDHYADAALEKFTVCLARCYLGSNWELPQQARVISK